MLVKEARERAEDLTEKGPRRSFIRRVRSPGSIGRTRSWIAGVRPACSVTQPSTMIGVAAGTRVSMAA